MISSVFIQVLVASLTIILAIIGIFIDRKSNNFKNIFLVYLLFLGLLFASQIWSSWDSERQNIQATNDRGTLISTIDSLSISSSTVVEYITDPFLNQEKILKDFGVTEEREGRPVKDLPLSYWNERDILAANDYRNEIVKTTSASSRVNTKVWYYTKDLDAPILRRVLSELSFKIEDKKATKKQANEPTNAIWYGPNVDLEDYKLVITSLIRAGIGIQRLGPACMNTNQKNRVIEVGASKDAVRKNAKRKTILEIKEATSLEDISDIRCKT